MEEEPLGDASSVMLCSFDELKWLDGHGRLQELLFDLDGVWHNGKLFYNEYLLALNEVSFGLVDYYGNNNNRLELKEIIYAFDKWETDLTANEVAWWV